MPQCRAMDVFTALSRFGNLATRRELATVGIGRTTLDRAVKTGSVLPVRRGWVATEQADQLAVVAVLHGARLTSSTGLRAYGVWAGSDARVHHQVPPQSHRVIQNALTPLSVFVPPPFVPRGSVTHWSSALSDAATLSPELGSLQGGSSWLMSLPDCVAQFAASESAEQIAAALESAVHTGRLSRPQVAALIRLMPDRLSRLSRDLTFLAESGMETIARLRLERLGLNLAQQVQIGCDRVDLVIDGWLVIELDGDSWHDPIRDRIRTNRIIRSGRRVLRFGYAEIFERWDETVATVHEMLGMRVSA